MAERRYTAWQVIGFCALILALVAGACSGGLLIGFSLGRATARPVIASSPAAGPPPLWPASRRELTTVLAGMVLACTRPPEGQQPCRTAR